MRRTVLLSMFACVAAGCSGAGEAGARTPGPSAFTAPAARLTIERFSAVRTGWPDARIHRYNERFVLRETTGASAATVVRMTSTSDTGPTEMIGPECWQQSIQVPAGGTQQAFSLGASGPFGYCATVANGGFSKPSSVTLTVEYVDDRGIAGSTTASTTPLP